LLTLMFGVLAAFGAALLIGLAVPGAQVPVFVGLSIWWMWVGWRYAKQPRSGEMASAGKPPRRSPRPGGGQGGYLGLALKRAGDDWFRTFKSHTTCHTLSPEITVMARQLDDIDHPPTALGSASNSSIASGSGASASSG
jgi:hypothetical protein